MNAVTTNDMMEQIIGALAGHESKEFLGRRNHLLKQQLTILVCQVRSEQLSQITRELAGLIVIARAHKKLSDALG
ncbi:hypothetical protein LK540_21795 [Massilia sp. IC2-278]|uniref:hypothetical protein n=1 Tax=Massilia sp. IC2-278 TaxID=2887200 RepID=UPI001E2F0749|nr:hypothetical protein [Massilia sp. IC2-278]MCC2963071.1 hypothetical protein [Massilia sp. IC2-278]